MTIAYQQFESAPLIERLMREWRAAASEGDMLGVSALAGVPDLDAAAPAVRGTTIFDLVVERLAESMTLSLRALISHRLTVEVLDVRPVITRAYLAEAPTPALLAPIVMGDVAPRGILLIAAPLGCAMVDHLFGARGRSEGQDIFARAFNATEQALMARLAEAMLQDLSASLASVVDMPCRMEKQQADAAEQALQLRLSIQLNGQGGTVDLLLPYAALSAFPDVPRLGGAAEKISAPAPASAPAPKPMAEAAPPPKEAGAWAMAYAGRLQSLPIAVDLSIMGASVPLAQLVGARVGDALWLGSAAETLITLSVEKVALLEAQLVGGKNGLALAARKVAGAIERG